MVNLITEHIDIWTSAQTQKANGGRGRGNNSNGQSPHGIKKLRELILELAVRGKLVSQHPNDEPGSVLIEKIAEEKARLIKEGEIKKQKPFPEISEDEKPFELPEGWEWVRLGNVGNIFNGNSVNARVKEEKYTNIEGGLAFIATKDVGYGWEELDYGNGVSIPKDEPKFKVAQKRAVLICAEGGSAGKKCGITNQDICFGNKLFANELYGNIESSYILANYLSPTFFYQFSDKMTGIIGGISAAKFSQLLLPIPPLAEQHRIVAKVDELMAICDELEQQQTDSNATHQTLVETLLATLTNAADQREFTKALQRNAKHFDTLFTTEQSIDQLKQTILQLAVMGKLVPQNPNDEPAIILLEKISAEKARLIKEGKIKKQKPLPGISEDEKIFELPVGWAWSRLDDLALRSEAGWSPKCESAPREGENWGVLKVSAITWGRYNPNENKALPSILEPRAEYEVMPGDFLISRANTSELVARAVVVEKDAPARLMMSDKTIRFVFSLEVNVEFVNLANSSPFSRDYYARVAGGTSSSMKNVSRNQIRTLVIALPPILEQLRIVAKVDELMEICDTLKSRLNDAQTTQVQMADAIVEQAVA